MSTHARSKIGIQERGLDRDFTRGFYVGPTFPSTKVNGSDVFKCYAAISGELELFTDFPPDVKVGQYTNSEASEVIGLQAGQMTVVPPNVILQQRGYGEMAALYFSSKVTKNERVYTLRPDRQVIPVPDELAQHIFAHLRAYSQCGWRGEPCFRIIDHLRELVDTAQARREVEDFLARAMKFIRHHVAANAKAPGVRKLLAEVKIPAAYRRAREFERVFKEQVGVPIRTFCSDQRLHLAVVEAARYSMSFARDSLRYTCANFNHAFSRSFGVSPSAAYLFSDFILERV